MIGRWVHSSQHLHDVLSCGRMCAVHRLAYPAEWIWCSPRYYRAKQGKPCWLPNKCQVGLCWGVYYRGEATEDPPDRIESPCLAPTEDGLSSGVRELGGILVVQFPLQWIISHVCADFIQFAFIPDDVFIIIALPDRRARRSIQCINPPGRS